MILASNEFGVMEDWDLQAVVRGSCTGEAFATIMNNNTLTSPSSSSSTATRTSSLFSPVSFDEDLAAVFPEFFASSSDLSFDGLLEGFCNNKPFYPHVLHQPISTTSTTQNMMTPKPVLTEMPKILQAKAVPEAASGDVNLGPKPRRRKNQQKRVVHQVTEDGLSADMWAWRKYGQKPIKGSPYPRSYYRCSSLKGCLARKQVERSSSDPSVFIITYTAEHSHAHPTRRNSLAGTTRVKSSQPKIPDTTTTSTTSNEYQSGLVIPRIKEECASPNLEVATPNSMTSIEDEQLLVQHGMVKYEEEEQNAGVPDIVFSDELFPSLEDFEGIFLDQFSDRIP